MGRVNLYSMNELLCLNHMVSKTFVRQIACNSHSIFTFCPQAQLRFCLLETSCEQEDHFPPSVNVKVNNKMCPLPVSMFVCIIIIS